MVPVDLELLVVGILSTLRIQVIRVETAKVGFPPGTVSYEIVVLVGGSLFTLLSRVLKPSYCVSLVYVLGGELLAHSSP